MIPCEVCQREYVVITQLHLRKHDMNIESYLETYPLAKIVRDYECDVCGEVVNNGKSSRSKYCSTIMCHLCKLITNTKVSNVLNGGRRKGHLWDVHMLTNEDYSKMFPDIKLISCSEEINRINVLHNVRQYNSRKKRFIQRSFREANREYGIDVNEDHTIGETRIDNTHSAWDYLPQSGYKVLGSLSDKDLEADLDGRVIGLMKLRREMQRMKRR